MEEDDQKRSANLLARLDRLPITGRMKIIIGAIVIAWLVEAFDIGITGQLTLSVKEAWKLTSHEVGLIGIANTIGMVLALIPAGWLADRYGRKKVLVWGTFDFIVMNAIGGLSWDLPSLVAFRFLSGLGVGAVSPLPYLMLSEYVGVRKRTTTSAIGEMLQKVGYSFPGLIAIWSINAFPPEYAWRVPMAITIVTVVIVPIIIRFVPESPRYLLQKRRFGPVEKLVEELEDEAGLPHDKTLEGHVDHMALKKSSNLLENLRQIFRPPYLRRTLIAYCALLAIFTLWYPLLNYVPYVFHTIGVSTEDAFLATTIMMLIGGASVLCMGHLSDKFGRKVVYGVYLFGAIIGITLMTHTASTTLIIIGGIMVGLFEFGNFVVPKVYVAEQYPTHLRGTGTATGEMTVRLLSGIVLSYFIPVLLDGLGAGMLFGLIAVAMVILGVPMLIWGRETAGVSIDKG